MVANVKRTVAIDVLTCPGDQFDDMRRMEVMRPVATEQSVRSKPLWRSLILLPTWVAFSLLPFAFLLLAAYAILAATGTSNENPWLSLAIATAGGIAAGVSTSRRFRRTVLASDENGLTIRLERVKRESA
jgi:hypothetical protein